MNEELVTSYEEILRKAMIEGDIDSLDQLIDKQLIFVNHFGQALSKKDEVGNNELKVISGHCSLVQ